ncbi:hypothetical protein M3Y99_00908000 [Aphelenchoides fujianensis]|nr:hypothetical protein M3Y99_00908000 [Aphelenchoides fujianensis]
MQLLLDVDEVPPADFEALRQKVEGDFCFNTLHNSLAFCRAGLLKRTELRVWRAARGPLQVYGVVHSNSYDPAFTIPATDALAARIYEVVRDHHFLFIYTTEVTMALQLEKNLAAQKSHPHKWLDERNIVYFADQKQREMFAQMEIQLPEGFRFDELKAEDFAEILKDQSCQRPGVDPEAMRARLSAYPSAAVYHENGELACYQSLCGLGYISPRYTRCKYRFSGLCAPVEQLVARKCWTEFGIVPAKSVAIQSKCALEFADRSPFWTKFTCPKGCAVLKQYLILARDPGHRMEFFESCINW